MRRFAAAVAAFTVLTIASLAPPAPAFAQSGDISAFTVENVSALVSEIGGTKIETEKDGTTTFVNFEMGGQTHSFSIRLCDAIKDVPGCLGLLMAIAFETDTPYALEVFNNFNLRFPLVTAVKVDDKTLAFGRMMFSYGGLKRENIKANVGVLIAAPGVFADILKNQVVASNEQGRPNLALAASAAGAGLRPVKLTLAQARGLMDDSAAKLGMPKVGGK